MGRVVAVQRSVDAAHPLGGLGGVVERKSTVGGGDGTGGGDVRSAPDVRVASRVSVGGHDDQAAGGVDFRAPVAGSARRGSPGVDFTGDDSGGDVALLITDFAEEDEKDDAIDLWDTQISELKHAIGL